MPSIREIRQRIRSIKNTAKITQAMQMVASSKMRRAQERAERTRPYAQQLHDLVARLATVSGDNLDEELDLLTQRPVRKVGIVLISPDRGLCGALPANVNRQAALTAQQQLNATNALGQHPDSIEYVGVGRKGRDFIVRTQQHMIAEFTNYGDYPSISDASAISQVAVDAFLKGDMDVVYLVYTKFINTVTQKPVTVQLLPVQPPSEQENEQTHVDYIYEPSPRAIFEALLPRYVDVQVYQALLESISSQLSAQMVAMKNATDNANELVQDLTLTYNKVRQAAITTQILEVVAGAEAL
jgi:F-type H+-transporting ATPase subunit gamma